MNLQASCRVFRASQTPDGYLRNRTTSKRVEQILLTDFGKNDDDERDQNSVAALLNQASQQKKEQERWVSKSAIRRDAKFHTQAQRSIETRDQREGGGSRSQKTPDKGLSSYPINETKVAEMKNENMGKNEVLEGKVSPFKRSGYSTAALLQHASLQTFRESDKVVAQKRPGSATSMGGSPLKSCSSMGLLFGHRKEVLENYHSLLRKIGSTIRSEDDPVFRDGDIYTDTSGKEHFYLKIPEVEQLVHDANKAVRQSVGCTNRAARLKRSMSFTAQDFTTEAVVRRKLKESVENLQRLVKKNERERESDALVVVPRAGKSIIVDENNYKEHINLKSKEQIEWEKKERAWSPKIKKRKRRRKVKRSQSSHAFTTEAILQRFEPTRIPERREKRAIVDNVSGLLQLQQSVHSTTSRDDGAGARLRDSQVFKTIVDVGGYPRKPPHRSARVETKDGTCSLYPFNSESVRQTMTELFSRPMNDQIVKSATKTEEFTEVRASTSRNPSSATNEGIKEGDQRFLVADSLVVLGDDIAREDPQSRSSSDFDVDPWASHESDIKMDRSARSSQSENFYQPLMTPLHLDYLRTPVAERTEASSEVALTNEIIVAHDAATKEEKVAVRKPQKPAGTKPRNRGARRKMSGNQPKENKKLAQRYGGGFKKDQRASNRSSSFLRQSIKLGDSLRMSTEGDLSEKSLSDLSSYFRTFDLATLRDSSQLEQSDLIGDLKPEEVYPVVKTAFSTQYSDFARDDGSPQFYEYTPQNHGRKVLKIYSSVPELNLESREGSSSYRESSPGRVPTASNAENRRPNTARVEVYRHHARKFKGSSTSLSSYSSIRSKSRTKTMEGNNTSGVGSTTATTMMSTFYATDRSSTVRSPSQNFYDSPYGPKSSFERNSFSRTTPLKNHAISEGALTKTREPTAGASIQQKVIQKLKDKQNRRVKIQNLGSYSNSSSVLVPQEP